MAGGEKNRVFREGVEGLHSLVGTNDSFLEEVIYKMRPERRTEIYLIFKSNGESSGVI